MIVEVQTAGGEWVKVLIRKVAKERLRVFRKAPPRVWDGRFQDFELDVQSAKGAVLLSTLKAALALVDVGSMKDSEVSDEVEDEKEEEEERRRKPPRAPSFDRDGPGGIGDWPPQGSM